MDNQRFWEGKDRRLGPALMVLMEHLGKRLTHIALPVWDPFVVPG
jgi:hypothetical protein